MPHPLPRRLFLLGMLGLLAAGCSRSSGPAGASGSEGGAATPVTLQLNWVAEPEFGGFYAARDGGAYARAGLAVAIAGGGAGSPVTQQVATGRADFGVTSADDVLIARARGADVIPVFATYQTSPRGIMVHASRGAQRIADVLAAPGTLAMEPGAAFGLFLKKKYGFGKVRIVPYDGGVARFVHDDDFAQQCFITSEPLAAAGQHVDTRVFLVADEGYNPYQTVVITRRALWNERPEVVRAFARATREGWRAYLDDPGPANAVMAKINAGMDAPTFVAAAAAQKPLIETAETKGGKLGVMTPERWETLGRQLVDIGLIDAAPRATDFLFPILD